MPAALLAVVGLAVVIIVTGGSSTRRRGQLGNARAAASHASQAATVKTLSAGASTGTAPPATSGSILPQMLGQMIVARFAGPAPPVTLLHRIRRGQVGGVILFSDNVVRGRLATRRLTQELQQAAARDGNPPLLVMTDQEGGEVARLVGPPELAPADMESDATAFDEGAATGRLLRSEGLNVDLAPVADVERVPGSFLGSRAFGSNARLVGARACAFARGLASQGVAYTLKHFPGLGRATGNTDTGVVSVDAQADALRADYSAYSTCGANRLAMVMVSSAIYPALSGPSPAVMAPEIYRRELPIAVGGGSPLTISDDLQSAAIAAQTASSRRAVDAGVDLLMYAQSEQASATAYARLLNETRAGLIPVSAVRAADERILRLKRLLRPSR